MTEFLGLSIKLVSFASMENLSYYFSTLDWSLLKKKKF